METKILLHEEIYNINLFRTEAQNNLLRVRDICKLIAFKSEDEFNNLVKNSISIIKRQLLENKELKKLDTAGIDVMAMQALKFPQPISELKTHLENARQRKVDFTFLLFKNDHWEFDEPKFQIMCDSRLRIWAETPGSWKNITLASPYVIFLTNISKGMKLFTTGWSNSNGR